MASIENFVSYDFPHFKVVIPDRDPWAVLKEGYELGVVFDFDLEKMYIDISKLPNNNMKNLIQKLQAMRKAFDVHFDDVNSMITLKCCWHPNMSTSYYYEMKVNFLYNYRYISIDEREHEFSYRRIQTHTKKITFDGHPHRYHSDIYLGVFKTFCDGVDYLRYFGRIHINTDARALSDIEVIAQE